MRNTLNISALILIFLFLSGFSNPDNRETYPGDYNLFKIDRSRDADVVMYDVKLDSSLYIHFEDNSFWFPNISRIELKGNDNGHGAYITETITPATGK